VHKLAIGEVRADGVIWRKGGQRGRAEALSDFQRGCFIGLDA
jgi:hypothetical protein